MAYVAVISLKQTIDPISNHIDQQITKPATEELNSLVRMLKRLDDRSKRSIDRSVINALDSKIRDAAWKLEDMVDSILLLNIHKGRNWEISAIERIKVETAFDLFLKTVKVLREEYDRELLQKPLPAEEYDAAVPPVQKSTTIGLSDLSDTIRKDLLGWLLDLSMVSLVGMAGIGKTHLAAEIYHHPLIVKHFDSRLWVRVGPKEQTSNITLDIIAQIEGKPRDLFKGKGEHQLRDLIRNSLRTQRYLIVLDDIWSTQVLDYFIELLPDYGKRSRFLLTTRLQEVALHHQRAKIHQMPFLNNEESWNLLWQNVFGTEEYSFPSELEKAGRKIADKCEGLPLLILAVANILCGLDKTEEYWEMVAEKKTTTFTDAYDQIYEVLLSSYEYLPQHLKACFLYMGVFPQSCQIPLSKISELWTAEEFDSTYTPFNIYVDDLVSKSLAIVCKWSFERFRRIKSWKLHSAYWYVCVTEARKNNFFHVLIKLTDVISMERHRRLSVQNNILFGMKEVYDSMAAITSSTTRSLIFSGEDHQYPVRICFNMTLLKVLEAVAIRFYEFPEEVVNLLKLRYLTLTHNGDVPCSISELRKLWCLILRQHHYVIKLLHSDSTCLPDEIWDLDCLRHLRVMGSNLPDPLNGKNIQYLSSLYVNARSCTEGVFKGTPRLNKLGIKIELEPDVAAETSRCLEHIGLLKRLESVKCVVVNPRLRSQEAVAPPDHLSNLPPRYLKKLSLNGLGYSWKYMSLIGSLPNLEVLKLRCSAFQGQEWETEVGHFQSLGFLLLEDLDLVNWTTQNIGKDKCLPKLRHLIVRHCYKLKKIPLEIRDNGNLEWIEVDDCSPSVMDSAEVIKKKSRYVIQLIINSSWNL